MGALKTQDIPLELRTWWKHFQTASYRHDYARVFGDFITMTLTQFVKPGTCEDWHKEAMQAYDEKEKAAFNEMFYEIFNTFQEQVGTDENPGKVQYCDLFGSMYETLSSNSKRQSLGQFFTPLSLCEVVAQTTLADIQPNEKKTILDPACGSGRMLIVAHLKAPGNLQYGIDLDPLCAKMSCLNMLLHGCIGEVACANALWMDDWRWCFAVNPILHRTGVPSLMRIEKEDSFIWRQNQSMIQNLKAPAEPVTKIQESQNFLNDLLSNQIKNKK